MDKIKTKQKLSEALKTMPGYVNKIQTELFEKKQISVSTGKISQCLNPLKQDWNNDIIEAATSLIEAEILREEELHQRANSL